MAIEEELDQLENKNKHLEEQLIIPEIYTDHEKAQEIQAQINANNQLIDERMEEWEDLQM